MSALQQALAADPVVAVIRHLDPAVALEIARAAAAGGIRVLEITFTVPDAPQVIATLVAELPDAVVGAGTVLTVEQVDAAADAGAAFIVSPVTDPIVGAHCRTRGIPYIPGAFTPTEVAAAANAGAAAVKIFPASTLGVGFVASLGEVLPHVSLMPTGGIAADQVGEWLAAGATAVGIAGALGAAWRRGGAAAVQTTAAEAIASAATRRSTT